MRKIKNTVRALRLKSIHNQREQVYKPLQSRGENKKKRRKRKGEQEKELS